MMMIMMMIMMMVMMIVIMMMQGEWWPVDTETPGSGPGAGQGSTGAERPYTAFNRFPV